jgi:hypothetical protein
MMMIRLLDNVFLPESSQKYGVQLRENMAA